MILKISDEGDKLPIYLEGMLYKELKYRESFWTNQWTISDPDSFEVIKINSKAPCLLSSDANIKIEKSGNSGTITLYLKYRFKRPAISFEYLGNQFLIIYHRRNKYSYFKGDQQFGKTELEERSFKYPKFSSVFDDKILSKEIFTLSQLALVHDFSISRSAHDEGGGFTIDLSQYLFRELKPFNERWNLLQTNQQS